MLADLDMLAAAVLRADTALREARTARLQAEAHEQSLLRDAAVVWQVLRATRDQLVGLGAPELPDGSAMSGWTALLSWAGAQADDRAVALPAAQDAVLSAVQHQEETSKLLTDEFASLDVRLPSGELAGTAPVAAAAALTQARADLARIDDRRKQAADWSAALDAAQTDQRVAKTLGDLLRSNKFPEWLETAALDTLVIDASVNLAELSGGQFELTHRKGEFYVIDHADADSQRSVRTLSGGETFQSSLALALALSAQLSTLAASGAARLDSIFLDEGFGTLDEATLETVAETLENLAHGDRMVGVITHVAALAERIPARFVVHRDQRTSSVVRETV
jgi:exonuclease SbcC